MIKRKPYKSSKKNAVQLVSTPFISLGEFQTLQSEVERLKQQLALIETKLSFPQKNVASVSDILLPISIFHTSLSSLEVVVKYLKEVRKLRFSEIAQLLARNDRTVWHAYRRSTEKQLHLIVDEAGMQIPLSIFVNRTYAPLEVLVAHLRDTKQLTFPKIAAALERSPKTIWTVYSRWRKKNVV